MVLGDSQTEVVEPILDVSKLDSQHGYFKLAMPSNYSAALEPPFDVNPLVRLWRSLDSASICVYLEYMKLELVQWNSSCIRFCSG